MTPAAFARTYGTLAAEAAAGASVSPSLVLAQWAVETGWGTSALATDDDNLAGIRWYGRTGTRQIGGTPGKVGTGFAGYGTLGAFVRDYIHTLNLAAYAKVRALVEVEDQCRALGASPWDAGHYRSGGVVGGSLIAAWHVLPAAAGDGWAAHLASGAELRTYRVAPNDGGPGCIEGAWLDRVHAGAPVVLVCLAPIVRHTCPDTGYDHDVVTATIAHDAPYLAGKVLRVSAAHGVTVSRH